MTKRLAGVALAAVVACGGLAVGSGRAAAAPVTVSASGSNPNNDTIFADLSFDNVSLKGHLTLERWLEGQFGNPPQETSESVYVDRSYENLGDGYFSGFIEAVGLISSLYFTFDIYPNGYVYLSNFNSSPYSIGFASYDTSGSLLPPVPLPPAISLFGAGLMSLGGIALARRPYVKSQAASG